MIGHPQTAPTIDFSTLRLMSRPVRPADSAFYATLFGRAEITRYRPDPSPISLQGARAALARDLRHWKRNGFGRWALVHAGETVGLGGLTLKPGFDGLNVSYHLVPEVWGQGLASEFLRGALDWARDTLGASSVYGLVRPKNIASIRVLEKAGFRDAGLHRINGGPMRELRIALR